jgi:hypothetical protein
MITLDAALQRLGLAQNVGGQRREDGDQHQKDQAKPPVEEQGERQEDGERDQRREMVAEEAEPQPRHAVRALQHDLEDPARMGRRMEGERQLEHVLEIVRHGGEAAAVRQLVGMQRHDHPGDDGEEPETDPGKDQRHQPRHCDRLAVRALALRQDVDDATEQDGLGEGGDGQPDIGQGEKGPELQVGAELAENADIEADKPHCGSDSQLQAWQDDGSGRGRKGFCPFR